MRRYPLLMLASLIAVLWALSVVISDAQAQNQSPQTSANSSTSAPIVSHGATCVPGSPCQANPDPALRAFLLPLFISNASFKSTAVLVNSHPAATYADVTLHDAAGNVVVQQRVPIAARNQVQIDIGELLAAGNSGATAGSVEIAPATDDTGIGVIGQMSITYSGSPVPSNIDYEPARPGPSSSLVLRGVADAGQGSPIVGISSVAATAQHVTVQCFGTGIPAFSKTVTVPAMGTVVTTACNGLGGDPLASASLENLLTLAPGAQAQAEGISLTTDAPPGSFAAAGFAPHQAGDGVSLTGIMFSDPAGAKTSTTVFAGLPVGSAALLPGGDYVPALSVANFSSSPAQITVQYSQTTGDTPEVKTVATLTVPAGGTASAELTGLEGDPDLQNSFEVVSDQPPGEVFDNISSNSETGIRRVSLPGKDRDNSHNAGNHPWTVADGTDSTILLFNETSATESFPVLVSSGQAVWSKKYSLAPLATKAIDINEVIADQVKDDKGYVFPKSLQSGQANWYETPQSGGTGRVLQSNPERYSARSFSCGEHSVILGADFYPNDTSESDGQTNDFGEIEAQFGLTEDYGGCSGDYVGDGDAEYYFWSLLDPSMAAISGSADGSSVSVEGLSPGTASIEGNVEDADSGDYCEAGTSAPMTVTGDQTPVITGISPSIWPAGTTTTVTFTGQNFGSNQPALGFSDNTISVTSYSSYSDTQIVANVNVPSGTPDGEEVTVTVTNDGYGGNSFAPQSGGNPQTGNATATVAASGPTASVSIDFTGSKTSGDMLSFAISSTDCSESLGLQNCSSAWEWNIEGKGVVSDDASNWTVQQSYTGLAKGYYKDSGGNLTSFSIQLNVPNDGPQFVYLQQPSGQKTIYWIDGPGSRNTNGGSSVDSVTQVQNFTTKFCSTTTSNDCYSITWYLKLVVDPGSHLDAAKSSAGLGSTSTNF
ncbi:MAG: IPT/TIG domain-containing protein [Terracidiphilus sp.]